MNECYKALSNFGYSLKNHIVRPTKIPPFWPTKGNRFCVKPNDCRRQPLAFKQVKTFLAPPYLTALPPKRLVWIRHCQLSTAQKFIEPSVTTSMCENQFHQAVMNQLLMIYSRLHSFEGDALPKHTSRKIWWMDKFKPIHIFDLGQTSAEGFLHCPKIGLVNN